MSFRRSVLVPLFAGLTASLAFSFSCSPTFSPKSCTVDGDCGSDALVCEAAKGYCVAAADTPIRIGQSAPASGPSQDLGLEIRRGVQLAFDAQNQTGGVRGRPLLLDFRDDQYNPDIAEQNARALTDVQVGTAPPRCPTTQNPPVAGQPKFSDTELLPGPNAVIAVIGSVGTPTMVRSAPVIVETQRVYFGAYTGATTMLRNDISGACKKLIFNVRASYAQEARATLEYFTALGMQDDAHLFSFDQSDTFGDAGYNGLVAAYTAFKNATPTIKRFRYTRDEVTSVPAQVSATTSALHDLLTAKPGNQVVGILMTDTYGPGASYIQGVKDWLYGQNADQTALTQASRLTVLFSNISFVGPNSLASRLKQLGNAANGKPYSDNVFVSQVVPNYQTDNSDAVIAYRKLITAASASPTYTSFEGYIAARIFIEGLKGTTGSLTPANLATAFESLVSLNIGLGGFVGYTADNHQASKSVWGTAINADGTFSDKYFWSDGAPIQLAE